MTIQIASTRTPSTINNPYRTGSAPPVATATMYAPDILRRGLASLVDGMLFGLVGVIASVSGVPAMPTFALFAFVTLQFVWLVARGQSPGKKMFSLRVVRTDGTPIGFVRAFARMFAFPLVTSLAAGIAMMVIREPMVSTVFYVLIWIADLVCMFGEDQRRLADHFAGTRVIQIPPAWLIDD